MATAPHIFRRQAIFYWRRRLPTSLSEILQASHLCRSLRTSDRPTANRRGMLISVAVDNLGEDVSIMSKTLQQPTKAQLHRILFDIFNYYLDIGELQRATYADGSNPWHMPGNLEDSKRKQKMAIQFKWTKPEDYAREAITELNQNRRYLTDGMLRRYFQNYRLERIEDDKKRAVFERMVLAVVATAQRFNAERDNGIYNPAIFPFAADKNQSLPHSPLDAWERHRISIAHKKFVDYKTPEWDRGTVGKANTACKLFVELVGDIPYTIIQRNDAARFRDALDALPPRYAQLPIYKGLTPKAAAVRAAEIRNQLASGAKTISVGGETLAREEAEKASRGMHPTTTNNHIIWLHGFFEWAKQNGMYDGRNPFEGIGHSKERAERATPEDEKRRPWPAKWQSVLFHSPIWTGFASKNNRNKPGSLIIEDEVFWAPLIAIFSGMRMEEILQLWTKDVQMVEGVSLFSISASESEGKRNKTPQARRVIPVHSELIKMGFLRYVETAKENKSRLLFPGALRDPKSGKLEKYFSKVFATRIRALGIPPAYKFHTLRNTFDTSLQGKGLAEINVSHYLMGHKMDGESKRYVDPKQLKSLREIVEKVEPEIDFSFLYEGKTKRHFDFTEHPSRKKDRELL